MRVLLAGPDEGVLIRAAYPAFAAVGFDVVGVVTTPEELAELCAVLAGDGLVVVEADLYSVPSRAVEALSALTVPVAVILPAAWAGEVERFTAMPGLVMGFTAPGSWAQVTAELKARVLPSQGVATEVQRPGVDPVGPTSPQALLGGPGGTPPARRGRLVALWSGPAGGTGRTALALALAAHAVGQGVETCLLALSEPSVSAYLGLARVPNVNGFFETGDLARAVQAVGWEGNFLRVILGPARPRHGKAQQAQVAALVEAAAATYPLVLMDLPSLVPGGDLWSAQPLKQATDVLLVLTPTSAGVVAAVEALATLQDLEAPGRRLLVLNRRSPGKPRAQAFLEEVRALWGDCPPLAAEVPYVPGLAMLDHGELPDAPALQEAVTVLAEVAAGIGRPEAVQGQQREDDLQRVPVAGGTRQRRGRLIHVEVTD